MATFTKTIVEDEYSGSKSTWTVTQSLNDFTVTEQDYNFTIPYPSFTAKYVGSNKGYGSAQTGQFIYVVYTPGGRYAASTRSKYAKNYGYTLGPMNSGTEYPMTTQTDYSQVSGRVDSVFTEDNNTSISVPVVQIAGLVSLNLATAGDANRTVNYSDAFKYWDEIEDVTIANLILNAPPTATISDITKNTTDIYAGVTTVSVNVSDLFAYYGGDFTTTTEHPAGVKFEIGNQSDERHDNGTLSIALDSVGTFTPKVTVTDSRGQTYIKTFDPITVQEYNPTTNITTLLRVNATGEPEDDPQPGHFSDEGTNAVVACVFDYPIIASNYMKRPVVKIDGQSPTNTVNWYTSWTENGGFSGQVSFSSYNPTRPVTLYGKITDTLATDQSYEISVACNTTLGTGSTDAQTLPQAFYLLSAAAGGHGLGVGMKVPEDPDTHKKEGLHVDMDATFYKTTKFRQAPGIIKMYAGNSAPDGWLLCDGSAVSRTDYSLLYAVIGTTYGAGDGSTTFNVPDLSGRFALGAGEPNDNTTHAWGDNLTYNGTDKYNEPIGSRGGESKHQLTKNQLPKIQGEARMGWTDSSAAGIMVGASGDIYATKSGTTYYTSSIYSGSYYNTIGINVGNNESHNNMPPYTTVNYIISTGGPSEQPGGDQPIVNGVLVEGQSVVESGVATIPPYTGFSFEYQGNVGGTIYNATSSSPWTAPKNGIIFMNMAAATSGGTAYWYVAETEMGSNVALISMPTNGTSNSTAFPVIKGHRYYTNAKNAVSYAYCHYYAFG